MKVFVLKKNYIVIYSLLIVLTAGLIAHNFLFDKARPTGAQNTTEELPIYSVETQDKKIALTFDCAWDDADTDQIIEILKKYQAKSTFFAVGEWVDRCGESVKKYAAAGHEIMNHSNAHRLPTKQSKEDLLADLSACSSKIEALTGKKVTLYRAPSGDYNAQVVRTAREAGYQVIQWSVDSIDWKDLSSEEIYKRVIEKTTPGDILLFHTGKKNTPAALDLICNKLATDGYQFVPVSELIYQKDYAIDANGKQKPMTPTVIETFD